MHGWVLEGRTGFWGQDLCGTMGEHLLGSVEQNLAGTLRQGLFKTYYGAGSCRRYSYGGESQGAPGPAQGDVLCKHVVPAAGKVLNIPKTM